MRKKCIWLGKSTLDPNSLRDQKLQQLLFCEEYPSYFVAYNDYCGGFGWAFQDPEESLSLPSYHVVLTDIPTLPEAWINFFRCYPDKQIFIWLDETDNWVEVTKDNIKEFVATN